MELEPVRAPALVALGHGDLAVMRARRCRPALKQQAMHAHDPIDPLDVDRCCASTLPVALQPAPEPAIAVARQDSETCRISSTRPASSVCRAVRPSHQSADRARLAATFERATPRTSQTCFTGRPPATMASPHIPSWPYCQKQLTRERPDTFTQTASLCLCSLAKPGRTIHFCPTIFHGFAQNLVLHRLCPACAAALGFA